MVSMPGNTTTDPSLRRYCFTGVRGVGKSTVIDRIISNVPEIQFVSGSDILQEMMGENYKKFEYLPENEKYELRIKLNDILCEIQKKTKMDMVVDSHVTVFNLKTKVIDTIFTQKDIAFYTDLILLDSNPEKVYCHRRKDVEKKRIIDLETIKNELEIERREAIRLSEKYGINLHIVEMNDIAYKNIINLLK